jgi:hypothetical protein
MEPAPIEQTPAQLGNVIVYFVAGTGCDMLLYGKKESDFFSNIITGYGVPSENFKYKCHKFSSAVKAITQTFFQGMPLKDSNFVNNLTREIYDDLKDNHVVVFGHSFGGAIVNRVAEVMSNRLILEEKNKDPDVVNRIHRLSMVGLGSIYIPHGETQEGINILNYVSSSDVAIKNNRIVPLKFDTMTLTLQFIHPIRHTQQIVCALPPEDLNKTVSAADGKEMTTVRQMCTYEYSKHSPNGRPLCQDKQLYSFGTRGAVSILKWSEHTHYYNMVSAIMSNLHVQKNCGVRIKNAINIYECNTNSFWIEPITVEGTASITSDTATDPESIPESLITAGRLRRTRKNRRYKKRRTKRRL